MRLEVWLTRNIWAVVCLVAYFFQPTLSAEELAEPRIRIQDFSSGELLGKQLSVLDDPSARLTIKDIEKSDSTLIFKRSLQDVINLGFTASNVWIKLNLENTSDQSQTLYLEYSYPAVDILRLYTPDLNGTWLEKKAGDTEVDFQVDVVENRNPTFALEVKPGLSSHYILIRGKGSIQAPISLWTKDQLNRKMLREYSFLAVLYGFFIVMILYNSLLCLWFRSRAYLYYVSFIAVSTLNMMNLQGITQILFPRHWAIPLSSNVALIANISMVLSLLFSSFFLNLHPSSRRFHRAFQAMTVVSLIGMLVAFVSYDVSIKIYIISNLVGCVLLLSAGTFRSLQGFRPAYFFTVSWLSILIGHVLLTTSAIGLLPVNFFTSFSAFIGSAIEVVLLSLAMGDKMRFEQQLARHQISKLLKDVQRRNEEISTLNQHLEQLVEEKTRSIRSILKSIRLGIFMIGPDRKILPDTSDFLNDIFEETSLAGRDGMDLLFSQTSLAHDTINQTEAALGASLKEPVMMFDLNEHLLCREVTFKNKQGAKRILEYEWNPMSKEGRVDQILVTVKDVTEHRLLELKHQEKEDEFQILSEIVNVERSTYIKFAQQSRTLLNECLNLSEADRVSDLDAIRKVLANLHTIKGAARTLYLGTLSHEVHDLEQSLQPYLQNASAPKDFKLKDGLQKLDLLLKRYLKIAEEKLAMKQNYLDRIEFEKGEILGLLQKIEAVLNQKSSSPENLIELLDENRSLFYRYVYTDLVSHLQSFRSTLQSTAKELGKVVPELLVQSPSSIVMTPEGEELLSRIFVHILRNAVDHGIESDAERKQLGKRIQGRIEIKIQLQKEALILLVSDDGRGIHLGQLRERAESRGLVQPNQALTASETAELIFQPGFSTKSQATLVSGRGIGMDAVRSYVEEKGGLVSLELSAGPATNTLIQAFQLRVEIPKTLFRIIDRISLALAS